MQCVCPEVLPADGRRGEEKEGEGARRKCCWKGRLSCTAHSSHAPHALTHAHALAAGDVQTNHRRIPHPSQEMSGAGAGEQWWEACRLLQAGTGQRSCLGLCGAVEGSWGRQGGAGSRVRTCLSAGGEPWKVCGGLMLLGARQICTDFACRTCLPLLTRRFVG